MVSRLASSVSIMEEEMSVEPCTIPAALAITLWDTSNTAITILNVLDRMRMAAVSYTHLDVYKRQPDCSHWADGLFLTD